MTTPNTLLAAARLAYPDRPWRYFCGEVYWEDEFGLTQTVFSLTNPADAYALQISLEKDHKWKFWSDGENFHAEKDSLRSPEYVWFHKPTKPELLLKCVETLEAMK